MHIKDVYQSKVDPNTVFIIIEIEDMGRAQEFMKKLQGSGVQDEAGVISAERTVCIDMT